MSEAVKVRPEVKKAAKLLDETIPGWHWRVDPERLQMDDCSMCMLGQTFGADAELAIGRELYPKEWKEAAQELADQWNIDDYKEALTAGSMEGYEIGLHFFRTLMKKGKIGKVKFSSLDRACYGDVDNCEWISEIADRRAADPNGKPKRKRSRKQKVSQ